MCREIGGAGRLASMACIWALRLAAQGQLTAAIPMDNPCCSCKLARVEKKGTCIWDCVSQPRISGRFGCFARTAVAIASQFGAYALPVLFASGRGSCGESPQVGGRAG